MCVSQTDESELVDFIIHFLFIYMLFKNKLYLHTFYKSIGKYTTTEKMWLRETHTGMVQDCIESSQWNESV